ncbi:MAG: PHP domain-containing protein [Candidatus Zixiibacteriota bacterium]
MTKTQRQYIDLHIHTTASDSLLTPDEVVEIASKSGLAAISITDHDTIDGYEAARQKAEDSGIELIPGVELSMTYKDDDFHLLGYLIDCDNPEFLKKIRSFQKERRVRGEKMVEKLNELGIDLNIETVKNIAGKGSVGRPHLADALLREEYVHTYDEAFARYLGYHAPAYVPKMFLTPQEGIDLIHLVRGVAVLAHPGTSRSQQAIYDFLQMGLDGIEAYHSKHDRETTNHYINLANKLGLIYTGGSDCHGRRGEKVLIGTVKVPYHCLEMLKRVKEENY